MKRNCHPSPVDRDPRSGIPRLSFVACRSSLVVRRSSLVVRRSSFVARLLVVGDCCCCSLLVSRWCSHSLDARRGRRIANEQTSKEQPRGRATELPSYRVRCRSPVADCRAPFAGRWSPIADRRSPVASRQSSIADRRLPIADRCSFTWLLLYSFARLLVARLLISSFAR